MIQTILNLIQQKYLQSQADLCHKYISDNSSTKVKTNIFIPSKIQAEQIQQLCQTPVFVTDETTIIKNINSLNEAFTGLDYKIFYALKANYNPHIVSFIKSQGVYGIDAVSLYEVQFALKLGYKPEQIIFTGANVTDEEMKEVGLLVVLQNLGSLSELERLGKLFNNQELPISIRLSPDITAGENAKVKTGHYGSKFGITLEDLEQAHQIILKYNLKLIGLHFHIGSGYYSVDTFSQSVYKVLHAVKTNSFIKNLKFIDFGGGFGVSYKPTQNSVDLNGLSQTISESIKLFEKINGNHIEIWIEPGKYLVSTSTALLVQVTTIKQKRNKIFVGVDSGFNHLIRPAFYNAYHHIVNISAQQDNSNEDDQKQQLTEEIEYQVVGNICETGDVFNKEIVMKKIQEKDLLAILVSGGYGASMSQNYNMRPLAAEVSIKENGEIIQTRKRQTLDDLLINYTFFQQN